MKLSFPGVLFLIFMVLKLCGVIDWSWWWVTAPLWGLAALWLAVFTIVLVAAIIVETVKILAEKK